MIKVLIVVEGGVVRHIISTENIEVFINDCDDEAEEKSIFISGAPDAVVTDEEFGKEIQHRS